MLGVIPLGLIVVGSNTFIGPATLSETPEGYTPKYWEYYRVKQSKQITITSTETRWFQSPVTRFLARYFFANPQQEYEKYLAYIFVEHEKIRLRQLEKKVKTLMHERQDYQAYYYKPVMAKYYRQSREYYEERLSMRGEK